MTKDEALKLALEALLDVQIERRNPMQKEAITAIKEALAQPAHTGWPEGLLQDDDRKLSKWLASKPDAKHVVDTAQETVADAARYQHIKGMARAMSLDMGGNHYWHMGLQNIRGPNLDEAIDRAIEAKLKEKNT